MPTQNDNETSSENSLNTSISQRVGNTLYEKCAWLLQVFYPTQPRMHHAFYAAAAFMFTLGGFFATQMKQESLGREVQINDGTHSLFTSCASFSSPEGLNQVSQFGSVFIQLINETCAELCKKYGQKNDMSVGSNHVQSICDQLGPYTTGLLLSGFFCLGLSVAAIYTHAQTCRKPTARSTIDASSPLLASNAGVQHDNAEVAATTKRYAIVISPVT